MGFESTYRQVRDQLAKDLARIHNLDLPRAAKIFAEAERLAVDDSAQRSIRQLFVVVLRRHDADARDNCDAIDGEAPVPGRETLAMHIESLEEDVPSPPVTEAARAQSLETSTRYRMEQAFGVDFNGVSIFRDSLLATGATRARAKYDEIHFRRGDYQPGTAAGDRLIAHELAHVVQQRGGTSTRTAARHDLEREADRAAGQIARGQTVQIALRGQPGATYAYDDDEAHHDEPATPSAVEQDETGATRVTRHWLDALGGSTGRPLPADLRRRLETALKADLSAVRVHDGSVSDAAAKQINANAFTLGKDIHFAQGRYQPGTPEGQELIAHEAAHTVQAGHGTDLSNATISTPGDAREVEAHRFASEFIKQQVDADAAPNALRNGARGRAPAIAARGPAPAAPGVMLGNLSRAVVHRDGGDGPKPAPNPKPKQAALPPAKDPGIDKGEVDKNAKDANNPEQDRKDKEKFENDNPSAKKDPEPIKPAVKNTAPKVEVPKAEKKATPEPQKPAGGKGEKTTAPPPAAKGGGAPTAAPKAPAKPKAEAAVCAAVDQDVAKFWASHPKDPKARDVSNRSKEIWAAAQALGPAPEADDMVMALDPTTALYKRGTDSVVDGLKGSDLGQAIMAYDQSKSPYNDFNEKYRNVAKGFAIVRDVAYNLSNVLGKVGLALTIVGFILSLFGVGAILITIGRVLSVINFILDAVAAAAGIALVITTACAIKDETDPYKRAKMAKSLIADCNKAASNVVNMALASKGVGKVVGKLVKGVGKVLGAIARPVAKVIANLYAKLSRFFAKLAKSKGAGRFLGKAFLASEKVVGGAVKKMGSNRAKVLAEADVKVVPEERANLEKQNKKIDERNTAKQGEKTSAESAHADAKQKKIDADAASATAKDKVTKTGEDLTEMKEKAEIEKGKAETAKGEAKTAKKEAARTEKEAAQAEKAKAQSEKAKTKSEAAAAEALERKKTADALHDKATADRMAAEKAEGTAKTAAEEAAKAEKLAVDAANKAREAAAEAKRVAGGDAQVAARAVEDAEKAAAEAQRAADNVVTAQKQKLNADAAAVAAKDKASATVASEKQLNEAKAAAAERADELAKQQKAAEARAAEAQAKAAEAQAQAKKAQADQAAVQKAEAEAKAAATERAKADTAKQLADEAAARKVEAEAAASKAKQDAVAAAEAKAAADNAVIEKQKAEKVAADQKIEAERLKKEAAAKQTEAQNAAAESKRKSDELAAQQVEAERKVKADQEAVAARERELKAAEAERHAKVETEAKNQAAAENAQAKAEAARTAKQAADRRLESDTKVAHAKRKAADAQKLDSDAKQTTAKTAAEKRVEADHAAKEAEKAAKTADEAAKDAEKAAEHAKTNETNAEGKVKKATERAAKAEMAKAKADADAEQFEGDAKEAERHAKEMEQHKKDTAVFDPTTSGPTPKNQSEIADDMRPSGAAKQGITYSLGQWQQEVATKNDARDQWGLSDFRKELDKPPMRAPRMNELRASAARSINVSEAVDKIFAKKVEEPAQKPGATPPPGGTAPSPATAPAPEPVKDDPAAAADVGPLPYWPELVQDYNFDLGAMAEARSQVTAYRAEQQKALATAKGDLKKRAAEIRAEAAARKAPVKDNQTGLDRDKTNLDEAKAGSKQQLDNDAKADAKRTEADGPANEGSGAAEQAAAAEPPPAKGWWGKIKAAANWLLKNTLGRAMKFVTDAITNVVLFGIKKSMGLDVKEMANYGMQTTEEGKTKAAEGSTDTATAGTTNTKVEADIAVEDMTLGQRIQAGEKNLKEADDFEAAIDAQEKSIQAEIKACNDFVAQVKAQFDKCKADAEKAPARPPEAPQQQPQPTPTDAATPSPTDAKPDGGDPDMESKLKEARTLCSGSVDTEIANLKALHAKGSGILMQDAGSDAASIAEAERLSHQIEAGALKTAVGKLEALKSKADGGNQDAVVAVAHEIETVCHDGTDTVIAAYVSAEHMILAIPPQAATSAPSSVQPHP